MIGRAGHVTAEKEESPLDGASFQWRFSTGVVRIDPLRPPLLRFYLFNPWLIFTSIATFKWNVKLTHTHTFTHKAKKKQLLIDSNWIVKYKMSDLTYLHNFCNLPAWKQELIRKKRANATNGIYPHSLSNEHLHFGLKSGKFIPSASYSHFRPTWIAIGDVVQHLICWLCVSYSSGPVSVELQGIWSQFFFFFKFLLWISWARFAFGARFVNFFASVSVGTDWSWM